MRVEFVALADALGAFRSNLLTSAEMHAQNASCILVDVHGPLLEAREEAVGEGRALCARGALAHKAVRGCEDKYRRALLRYRAALAEEAASADAALEAGASQPALAEASACSRNGRTAAEAVSKHASAQVEDDAATVVSSELPRVVSAPAAVGWTFRATTAFIMGRGSSSSGSSGSSAQPQPQSAKKLEQWLLPSEGERLEQLCATAAAAAQHCAKARLAAHEVWRELGCESRSAVIEAQRVLSTFQQSEEVLIRELRDSLRKLVVFNSSTLSTRHYDLQQLSRVLDDIEPARELASFVQAAVARGRGEAPARVNAASLFRIFAATDYGFSSSSASSSASSEDALVPPSVAERDPAGSSEGADAASDCRFVPLAVTRADLPHENGDASRTLVDSRTLFECLDAAAKRAAVQTVPTDSTEPRPPSSESNSSSSSSSSQLIDQTKLKPAKDDDSKDAKDDDERTTPTTTPRAQESANADADADQDQGDLASV